MLTHNKDLSGFQSLTGLTVTQYKQKNQSLDALVWVLFYSIIFSIKKSEVRIERALNPSPRGEPMQLQVYICLNECQTKRGVNAPY